MLYFWMLRMASLRRTHFTFADLGDTNMHQLPDCTDRLLGTYVLGGFEFGKERYVSKSKGEKTANIWRRRHF